MGREGEGVGRILLWGGWLACPVAGQHQGTVTGALGHLFRVERCRVDGVMSSKHVDLTGVCNLPVESGGRGEVWGGFALSHPCSCRKHWRGLHPQEGEGQSPRFLAQNKWDRN